jgi:peptidoglycan/LPS O-acetylase OafA/YrhL
VADTAEQPYVALQGLRALAAICVMSFHWNDFVYDWLLPLNLIDVDVFFAAEGFFAASALMRTNANGAPWSVLGQHLLKIYPVYLIALLWGVLLALPLGVPLERSMPEIWPQPAMQTAAALNFALLPAFVLPNSFVFPFNVPSWAIVLEIYAFVLLVICRRWLSVPTLFAIVGAAALVYAGTVVATHEPNPGFGTSNYWGGFPRVIFGFFGGALLYVFMQRFGSRLPRVHPLLAWGLFIGLQFPPFHVLRLPFVLFAVPLIVLLAAAGSNPRGLRGIAQEGGRLAHGIYILCAPVMVGVGALANLLHLPKPILFGPLSYLLQLALVIVLAYGARRFIEAPLRGRAGSAQSEEAA